MASRESRPTDPFSHLLRRKRRRSVGSLQSAAKELWLDIRCCSAARDLSLETGNMEDLRRFMSLQAVLIKTFAELTTSVNLEKRVQQLEAERAKGVAAGPDGDDELDELD